MGKVLFLFLVGIFYLVVQPHFQAQYFALIEVQYIEKERNILYGSLMHIFTNLSKIFTALSI